MPAEINYILRRIQQGDVDAMNDLYVLTKRGVFSFILPYVHDVHLTEDIMQETYLKVFQHIDQFTPKTNGLNWILTIAKHTAFNLIKLRQREQSIDVQTFQDTLSGGYDTYNMDSPTILKIKEILPEDEATIVLLHAVGDYKHREIASILNVPIGTITWKYNKAMKTLREVLQDE